MVILPAELGAVAVRLKAAVPAGADETSALDKVTLQLSKAPAADGKEPQLTALTPVPGVTAVATTPAGNCSEMRADVPEAEPPEFPRPNV